MRLSRRPSTGVIAEHPSRWLPRRTVRLRLTLLYGGLFLFCGAALLTVTYLLVVRATDGIIFKSQNTSVVIGHSSSGASAPPTQTQQITPSNGPPPITPQAAEQLAVRQHNAELHQLLLQSGIALAIMTVAALALGWLVAGRVLRPLRTMTRAVRDISATNLHQRLALDGPADELRELGDTFDALLTRLDASFQSQRRFIAHASHELRTPLARQRALAQVALADPDATSASLRAAHERVLAAGEQQERVIAALLNLAHGQAGTDHTNRFDLAATTHDILDSRRVEAHSRELDLHAALPPAPITGDPRLIEQLVVNLVDNALRHNHAGGDIDVQTSTDDGRATLTVANSGPHVPSDAIDRLFEPFQRLTPDRIHHNEGLGLGLSIVRAIVDSHGADIVAEPRLGGGLTVCVTFPGPHRIQADDPKGS